jgi:hypothetical protein
MNKQDNAQLIQAWQEAAQKEVSKRPWLAPLLWQKGRRLFERFTFFYNRLLAAPRKLRRRIAMGVATAALILALSGAPTPAYAATITVTPGAAGIVNDGQCSLVEAIINANNDAATHADCAAGSGADTIVLAGSAYSYTTAFGSGAALPNITSPITIQANGATIQREGSANMRLIRVNAGGNLTLNQATITGGFRTGSTDNAGGGIYNDNGTLTLNNSTVSGNSAFYGGGISTINGMTTINNSTISNNFANTAGGVESFSDSVTNLNNSTISSNLANNEGGGISNSLNSTTNLVRTIISGNISPVGAEGWMNTGAINGDNHNVLGHSGLNNANAFSGFTPSGSDVTATSDGTNPTALAGILNPALANNGGPTLTHALVTSSPAIDIAPATACSGAPINGVDQRGVARSQDGNASGTTACDAGAVEMGQLQCGIQAAALPHLLTFAQANNVSVNVTNNGTDLDCVRVTEIGHDHPHATSSASNMALETGRYWQIASYQNSTTATPATEDFMVDLALPFASADVNSRVCKWLGIVPPAIGFGWDCGDENDNDADDNVSVTRLGVDSFSDWAVGDDVGPTAVTLQSLTTASQQGGIAALAATLLAALSGVWLWARRLRPAGRGL